MVEYLFDISVTDKRTGAVLKEGRIIAPDEATARIRFGTYLVPTIMGIPKDQIEVICKKITEMKEGSSLKRQVLLD